jgi:hypothetical protein
MRWLFIALSIPVLASYLGQGYFSAACHREVAAEDYLSAQGSCLKARMLGWPFQWLQPTQYGAVLNDLGHAEVNAQRYEAAKDHLAEALQRFEQATPEGSQEYANTMHNLGVLNQILGDIKQAEIWYLKSLTMFGKVAHPCDPNLARAGPGLGSALNALNKADEAEVVLLTRSKQNDSCPNLSPYIKGITLRILAEAQTKNDKENEALETIDSAISLVKEARGDQSLELAYALVDRAIALRHLARYAECQEAIALALPMFQRFVGPNSPDAGTAKSILANSLRDQGKLQEALDEYSSAEKIYLLRLGKDHPRRATLLLQMAMVTRELGRKPESYMLFLEAERIRATVFGSDSPEAANVREAMKGTEAE